MRIKFMCLNVWLGGLLWEPMLKFLKDEQPDILAVQEAYGSTNPSVENRLRTTTLFKSELGYAHASYAPVMIRANEFHGLGQASYEAEGNVTLAEKTPLGNAIFSKYPITNAEHWFYDVPFNPDFIDKGTGYENMPHNLQHVTVDIKGKFLHVFNTQGAWGPHGNDTPRRLMIGTFITEKIKDKKPAILCGDFNVNEGTESMNMIGRVYADLFKTDARITSFNMKRKPAGSGYKGAVVDFIFTSPDINVISHSSPAADVSDHLPLICEVEL